LDERRVVSSGLRADDVTYGEHLTQAGGLCGGTSRGRGRKRWRRSGTSAFPMNALPIIELVGERGPDVPAYPMADSGMWRTRPIQAIDCSQGEP
jgi:hypothetical protein